jgi:thiol-disulfide isomerase/thioredoxin
MRKILAASILFLLSSATHALDIAPYTAEKHAELQAQGKPSVLHFHAPWCGTCVAQEAALQTMAKDKLLARVTVLVVDYDSHKPLRSELKIKSQSTLVIYKGSAEVTRTAGEADAGKLRAAFSKAL